jgi:flagellar protein FlaD
MSEGDQNTGQKILDDPEIGVELTSLVERNILPQKIAQKIGEKLIEKKVRITKDQLYKLTDKIQNALRDYPLHNHTQPDKKAETQPFIKDANKSWNNTAIATSDMQSLVQAVEKLSERLKVIEEHQLDGVKEVSGKLVRIKDVKTLVPTDLLEEDIQPLERMPSDPESIVVIMKWLQYLVDKVGKNNLPNILGYYVDIGWISDDARLDLIEYSKGIIEVPNQANPPTAHLPSKDHVQSLLYVQKLKGVQLDDRFLIKIERDMEKIVKSLEGYPLK